MPLPNELTLFQVTPPEVLPQASIRITVPEAWRAELYRPALEAAWLTLDGYAARAPRVAEALRDRNLLERVALILDEYVAPGVVADVNAFAGSRFPGENITEAMYVRYVAACLQGAADPYRPSAIAEPDAPTGLAWVGVEVFYRRYPQIRFMVDRMSRQYVESVLRCCDRLLEDWADIGTFFFPAPLAVLARIRGTGSDFHKGGQQVFLLDLRDTANTPRRLVYKPGDVERDFRVTGDTQALAAALGNLHAVTQKGVTQGNLLNNPGGSLAEMMAALSNAAGRTVPVTTYRILPVNPGTSLAARPDGGYDLRRSYGWIEFLTHEDADRNFPNEQALDLYYQAYGGMLALAYLFQVTDLHQENLIVHALQPYLIDLEAVYTGIEALPAVTGLQAAYNQFDAPILARVVDGWNTRRLDYDVTGNSEPTKNRPWLRGQPYVPRPDDKQNILAYFSRATNIVLANVAAFSGWINAAAGTIPRLLPFGTASLLNRLRAFFDPGTRVSVSLPDQIELRVQAFAREELPQEGGVDGWGDQFVAGTPAVNSPLLLALVYYGVQPRFAFWLHAQTALDFEHGDIPVFYQRLGTALALDSSGAPIAVSFDPAIQETSAVNQQPLATELMQVWNTAPLLPSTYFPQAVTLTLQAYLTRLQADQNFREARLVAAQQNILGW